MYFKNLYFACLFDSLRLSQQFYAPDFGKSEGAYNFRIVRPSIRPSDRASVRPCVHPSVCPLQNLLHVRYSFEISYMDSSLKIIDTYFFQS